MKFNLRYSSEKFIIFSIIHTSKNPIDNSFKNHAFVIPLWIKNSCKDSFAVKSVMA